MVKVRTSLPMSAPPVTAERAARLFHLVALLGQKPQTRDFLTRRLAVGVRDFYRDLEILRTAGIDISQERGTYTLLHDLEKVRGLIPFPNPLLTLGEAERLARGRTLAHRRLKEQIESMTTIPRSRPRRKT